MAEMGLGYGSEFQLMRFLGHHRDELNKLIQKEAKIEGPIEWLDFPYEDKRISGDGEWKGIDCFKELGEEKYGEIETEWKQFWPKSGSAMSWDGVFRIGETWFFVEAKAHEEESYQKCSSKDKNNRDKICKAFSETQKWLGAKQSISWIKTDCYQLANRFAFIHFCKKNCDINAKLVYIGFINGFRLKVGEKFVDVKDEVHSEDKWQEVWDRELQTLGLNMEKVAPYILFVHPNCLSPRKK